MKCDLCNREKNNQGLLCLTCGDMVNRLVMIQELASASQTCEAARLARVSQQESFKAAAQWGD